MTFANFLPSEEVDTLTLARSSGRVEVEFAREGLDNNLKHLFQSGCGRVRFPSVDNAHAPEAVLINTSGGLTGGDHMSYDVLLRAGANLTVTGQAAEKIYKSVGPDVVVDTQMTVEEDAYLEWLPQETILFDNARFNRVNKVDLIGSAEFLAVEATILGRQAHGETVQQAKLVDGWEIRRNGKLVWYDRFRFDGMMSREFARSALLDGARAMATIVMMSRHNADLVEPLRAVANEKKGRISVTSLENGPVIVRALDEKPHRLRQNLIALISLARKIITGADRPMPAVWEV
ncbi:urease accessory protein UreD [Sneathiella glossodoripedis]|uniref:urease accessory protein UreD n=1 Tax=Sneathiella glossodoripedis TaxID=418853 RepID=UPI0011DC7740|nr:urease accessory protein UreD [Sneathiella glossodoripedis]